MARTVLRHIRVTSIPELKARILSRNRIGKSLFFHGTPFPRGGIGKLRGIDAMNAAPVVFR
jgi:hypothetical protein